MSAEQQVITIDDISADNAPTIYVTGGLGQFFSAVEKEVTAEVPDLSTRKGRERIASLAAKVSKSKAAVEKPGRDYLKRLKEMPKVVETELREFVTKMDALRDATRQPLTDWETANDARIDAHNDRLEWLRGLPLNLTGVTSTHVQGLIEQAEAVAIDDKWEEFKAEAASVKDLAIKTLRAILVELQRYEAEQAELARLRREAEERAEQDRIRLAQEQAVELERQRVALEQQAERDAAANREQALIDQAAAAQRAADQAARDAEAAAERQRLQLQLQTEQAQRAAEQAEASRIAAEQWAEQERVAAEKRAEQASENARLAEVARQKAAADEIIRQEKMREADKVHKAAINRAALEAFIAGGMPEACAKQAVTLIAQRKIPAITISY
ncbi:hypothetical protein J2W17_003615 [Pseudomonas lini]|uniref:hypothetical protein n=1 Tax=Pseudomonas lini TaxID=163011 RepID=UPI0027896DD4|nr:hypothetical protein [Pseudomonas lini]MDQ0124661.1 hypothetical protein [Pseudomonas lini]